MSDIALNQPIPDCDLLLTGNRQARLSDYRGQHLVLYFYPKASTSGCTTEGLDFTAAAAEFAAANCQILGASKDGLKAQENFKTKQNFSFDLVADTEQSLCQLFDVIKLKKNYGKEYLGIERSTFLIDAEGRLRREWRGVKVKGHVAEVLEALRQIQ
jgi:peroxiredoxin Q/BCP